MPWRAWHVFLAEPALADELLLNIAGPELSALQEREAISNWFFIRYWENGPHLRFRLKDARSDDFEAFGDMLRSAGSSSAPNLVKPDSLHPHPPKLDGWHADPSALPWFDQGDVHEIMYEPEYRRYGGPSGLAIGEEMFNISSRIVIKVIAATHGSWPKRESVALRLTCAAIKQLALDEAATIDFLSKMASAWRGFAPDPGELEGGARADYEQLADGFGRLWQQMLIQSSRSDDWPPLVQAYARAVAAARENLVRLAGSGELISPLTGIAPRDHEELAAALKSIMLSYVHMTNNRLGMSPMHEYRFAQMLVWASEDEVVNGAGGERDSRADIGLELSSPRRPEQ